MLRCRFSFKPLMVERHLSYRRLAELTRAAEDRGVTYAYLAALARGREYPSVRA